MEVSRCLYFILILFVSLFTPSLSHHSITLSLLQALSLSESDDLAAILFQICGPAHVAWQDSRWQELLHAYGVWIHVEPHLSVVQRATSSLVQCAAQSSNLAALCIHVTRLLNDLLPKDSSASNAASNHASAVSDFSSRIAMVAKARATAGSLNLFRLLVHDVIQHSCSLSALSDPIAYLTQVFTYKSRDSNREHFVAGDLMEALIKYLIQLHDHDSFSLTASSSSLPELYDATTCALQLLLVLFSSQLYSPMQSSLERATEHDRDISSASRHFFWDLMMQQALTASSNWTPRQLLAALMEWIIQRPCAPERSVQKHLQQLCRSVAQATTHKLGDDHMYETHTVVHAQAPTNTLQSAAASHDELNDSTHASYHPNQLLDTQRHNYLFDATKGVVMTLSSTILLLPLRLLSLAFHLFHNKDAKGHDYDKHYLEWRRQQQLRNEHLTRDVLWLTTSPVADLSTCLLLLVSNNERRQSQQQPLNGNGQQQSQNPFRDELAKLSDNRWQADGEGLPDLPNSLAGNGNIDPTEEISLLIDNGNGTTPRIDAPGRTLSRLSLSVPPKVLSVNFEALFKSFGQTAHTEVGALLLYTLLQASQSFADSIAVRSDLDTLVLPLLRTLYMATSLKHYAALDYASTAVAGGANDNAHEQQAVSIRSCPFRSLSQLYVIIILLLLFSQDLSFGSDAFRRVMVPSISWYKERHIKDISLGSVLVLCLLRSLTFNLNRIHDAFLLSNCCAILMNLSTSISDLHEYAALRLAAVTLSSMKRYATLKQENPDADEEDLANPTAMHGEVCRTLLRVVKQCFATRIIERNLHLVYAMVYHQVEFKKLVAAQGMSNCSQSAWRFRKDLLCKFYLTSYFFGRFSL
jgi:hypothetical protein